MGGWVGGWGGAILFLVFDLGGGPPGVSLLEDNAFQLFDLNGMAAY